METAALRGRVAVITGGTGVLCREMAFAMVKRGIKVAIFNRTPQAGQDLVQALTESGGEAMAVSGDVLDKEALIRVREAMHSRWGRCDILINGAGGNAPQAVTKESVFQLASGDQSTFFSMPIEAFQSVFAVNLLGAVLASQVFGEYLAARSGVIVNISSMSASRPMTRVPAYSAAKAGLENFTRWLAVYLAASGVRVNAIAPGFFLTEQNRHLLQNADGSFTGRTQDILAHTPMQRLGNAEDLIGTLFWLVDESKSGFVTGITVPVDGGFSAYAGV